MVLQARPNGKPLRYTRADDQECYSCKGYFIHPALVLIPQALQCGALVPVTEFPREPEPNVGSCAACARSSVVRLASCAQCGAAGGLLYASHKGTLFQCARCPHRWTDPPGLSLEP